ncbi:hypothetical protein BHUM_01338 [Candidatus Burkholderia humilis]|nr:hypothetical protein BHUM_01338 [Candidatus Burkholderia humilis]
MKRRASSRGTALPIVLLLCAMMLVTASAWLQTSLGAARSTVASRERVQAFHAADSALIRCARMLSAAVPSTSDPALWRNKASFASWPYAPRALQCLIETWSSSYLITARGFGAVSESEAWLQLRVDAGVSHWRRVVAKPF